MHQVINYKKARKTENGPVMCAMDVANETTSSSSLEDCSLKCARNGTCKGFNIKDEVTCDVYNYRPKITALVPGCLLYRVCTFSIFKLTHFHFYTREGVSNTVTQLRLIGCVFLELHY